MYGGLVASLIDCHSIWTAITFSHKEEGYELEEKELEYVTSEINVDYRKPTPLDETIYIEGSVKGEIGKVMEVVTEVGPENETTAEGEVLAVEVGDHY